MKQKLIEQLHNLIYEHETSNHCTSYDEATEHMEIDLEHSTDMFYDVGRYEALKEVLRMIQNIGE